MSCEKCGSTLFMVGEGGVCMKCGWRREPEKVKPEPTHSEEPEKKAHKKKEK